MADYLNENMTSFNGDSYVPVCITPSCIFMFDFEVNLF